MQVCKVSFCAVHAIGKRRIENLVDKLTTGVLVASDQQGKHKNGPHAVSEETKQKIRQHINALPQRKSHCSRSDNRKKTCDLLHVTIQASKSEEERAELQVELAAHQEKSKPGVPPFAYGYRSYKDHRRPNDMFLESAGARTL